MPAQETSACSTLRRKSKEKCAEPEKCPANYLLSHERIVSSAVGAMFGHARQRAPGGLLFRACVERQALLRMSAKAPPSRKKAQKSAKQLD